MEGLKQSKNNRIVIIGNNHPSYIVAYFAAQCLGISTVEISRNESLDNLLKIIEETGASYVVTDRKDLSTVLDSQTLMELFEDFFTTLDTKNTGIDFLTKIYSKASGSAEASIVYTSGTTGAAKGVILSHENFCFIASAVSDYLELNHEDRYALILPLCHTYGKSVLLSSFHAGAAVILLNEFNNIKNFLNKLSETKATILSAVPYHIHVLIKGGNLVDHDLSSLRAITSSANKLPHDTIDSMVKLWPGMKVYSMYGLTESTTRACYLPPELLHQKKNSCGKPLPGVLIKVVGEDGSDLSPHQRGNILIKGPNVMRGYFADQKMTNETLVDDWLKTGDVGYVDDEGFLYITGREKDIIKCAGERISALEIEEVLLEHEGVAEATVIGREDLLMGEILHAYVVLAEKQVKINEIRNHCFKGLSHNKIPFHYTFVDELPKTETGKVKKYLLSKN